MPTGKLIVIDGTDGSGKAKHTGRVFSKLRRDGIPIRKISFPSYGQKCARPLEAYLNGDFGSPAYVGPYFGSMAYAFDRHKKAPLMRRNLQRGINYISNRYFSSNCGHQGGKIDDEAAREIFLDWLGNLEFNIFGIPKPDYTVFVHMPPAIGQQFVGNKKTDRAYLRRGRKKDIHEEDLAHLVNAEQTYLYLADKYPDWVIVDCVRPELRGNAEVINDMSISPEKKVRSLEDINEEIYAIVRKEIK